ncbi:hypothetical protein RHGRI_021312 [Rhododendron griersonianum]|uniref:Uncharacterized protein n=1 Tax=Rhododendron griersonianum TaxID=479676 RepID=A0AAV6JRR8_9ERIC|nr:hypothetical protein RHGRI_021312 [Rhododendron griersonianum]
MVPVGFTLTAAVVAWLVIPLVLKSYYNESIIGTQVTPSAPFPYEASYWGALEDPLQCLISFFALSLAWKRGTFAHAFAVMVINEADRVNLANLDTLLSNAIFGLGLLALAAAAGFSMLYIVWIILAGELVVLLVGKDNLQNVKYGYYLRTSELVQVGDIVKRFQCQHEGESYFDSIGSEILGVFDWKEM